jgi:hypothetical protein
MFITDCFAYTDITAELRQHKETFVLAVKSQNDIELHLTLNYLQTKVLAEGLLTMINQASLKEFLETKSSHILGDMKIKLDLLQSNEINKEEVEAISQQDVLSAQTDKTTLPQIA